MYEQTFKETGRTPNPVFDSRRHLLATSISRNLNSLLTDLFDRYFVRGLQATQKTVESGISLIEYYCSHS